MKISCGIGARNSKPERFSTFRRPPCQFPRTDLDFLLSQPQISAAGLHKNIAYKPDRDKLSGG